jgi:hypothetical protein
VGRPGWTLQSRTNTLDGDLGTNWFCIPAPASGTQFAAPLKIGNDTVSCRLVHQ